MNTKEIKEKVKEIEELTAKLHTLQTEEVLIRAGDHEVFGRSVTVHVNDRNIPITVISQHSPFHTRCIKGKEMIHLGILKWYSAIIANAEAKLKNAKTELRKIINE